MTDEQFNVLKDEFIANIKNYFIDNGSIFPHLTIFANPKEENDEGEKKPALIHIPLLDEAMVDEESKDQFINEHFPQIAKAVKERFDPIAIAWTSEAWVRMVDKEENLNNWKDLPIRKEVIIISLETEANKECLIYDIKRDGKQINSEGEMVDKVELTSCDSLSNPNGMAGRFSNLFDKLKD